MCGIIEKMSRKERLNMELIYVYIKSFGDFISNCGVQLSNNFEVSLENRVLTVRKK